MSETESDFCVQQAVLIAAIPTSTSHEIKEASVEAGKIARYAVADTEAELKSLSEQAANLQPKIVLKKVGGVVVVESV